MQGFARRHLLIATSAALIAPALACPAIAQSRQLDRIAYDSSRMGQLRTLVIRRDGRDLLAQAFRGPGLDQPANIKSVSKTIVALLTGIAIDRGVIEGTGQRVVPLLGHPPFRDFRDQLTVGDFLTMRTGLASTSGENYGAWVTSADWVDFVLNRPPQDRPGGQFIYSTGGWHVLGAALARAGRANLHQLARDWLGHPLGIAIPPWIRDPQGRYLGGNDMTISPLGLARIGDMVLQGGQFEGRRVVSRDWLDRSWQPRTRSPFSGDEYGYGWFLTRYDGQQAAYARGYGGQMLVVVPSRRLTITITSDPKLPARGDGFFGELKQLVDRIVATQA